MTKSILITGASSGIGEQLAHQFAARGYHLALAARRVDSLVALQQQLIAKHPGIRVEVRALDVNQYETVASVVEDCAASLGGLDIVVANAGIGDGGGPLGNNQFARDAAVIQTNVIGAMATMNAAVVIFKRQQRGQIVAISSVAGARGLPGAGAYSASKAAIAVFADAARAELYNTDIRVTTIYPGYIATPMNERIKSRPFLISVEKGGKLVADLIERRVQCATVPRFPWNLMLRLLPLLPTAVLAKQNPFAE